VRLSQYNHYINTKQDYTAMITTVNLYDFREAFRIYHANNFSYDGLAALFGYLEDLEEDTGEPMELDVIALCCDYTEYESLADYQENYGSAAYPTMEDIEYVTEVIYIDGTDAFIALGH
jgi:hypothetical protein